MAINPICRLDSRGTITICENVAIAEDVIILTADHNVSSEKFQGHNKGVTIEDYAWIGTRAMILPGVRFGQGAVIAAGAVVPKSIPAFEIWGGVSARKIGIRNQNLLYAVNFKRFFL